MTLYTISYIYIYDFHIPFSNIFNVSYPFLILLLLPTTLLLSPLRCPCTLLSFSYSYHLCSTTVHLQDLSSLSHQCLFSSSLDLQVSQAKITNLKIQY